jgi:hypothetical protein
MVLSIPISSETESRLRRLADAAGKDVKEYVSQMVEQAAARSSMDELLVPLRRQFSESGTSEEQLLGEIEEARDQYRAGDRKR